MRLTEQVRRSLSRLMSGAVGTAAFDADGTLVGSRIVFFLFFLFSIYLFYVILWSCATLRRR